MEPTSSSPEDWSVTSTPVHHTYRQSHCSLQDKERNSPHSSISTDNEDLFVPGEGGSYATFQQPKDPRSKAKYNVISRLLFFWLDSLFYLGFRRQLQKEDLYVHPLEADSGQLQARFNWYWWRELKRKRHGLPARFWVALAHCIQWRLILQGLLVLIEAGILLLQSVILGFLTEYFNIGQPTEVDTRNAYLYALGLVMLSLVVVVMHSHSFLMGQKMSMILRIISTGAIYKKVLSLSQATIGQLSVGHIINLASNDVQRFDPALPHFPYIWVAPLHLVVFTYLAYKEVGWTGFLASGFIILQVPLQIIFARLFVKLRFKSASLTDKRIQIMNEVITGIRVIKMYVWEYAFKNVVSKLRKQESNIIFKGAVIRACNLAYMIVSTSMIMWLVLTVHASTGGDLSTRQVFTLLSLLTSLRLSSYFFVLALLGYSEGMVAIHRIQKFLEHDDLALAALEYADISFSNGLGGKRSAAVYPVITIHHPAKKVQLSSTCFADSVFIKVTNMSASWSYNQAKLVLDGISFEVNENIPLLAVIGPVGSGKSSLLQCLLGELQAMRGSVSVQGSISYVPQEPWVFAGTLRDNILFGENFDQIWYEKVLEACSLDEDIEELQLGDLTLVGERGVTLSGGQKARVNLARAVYRDSDIFLLDGSLSALDVNVAMHIYDNCIRGLLEDKIVVLVTHQTQFALSADKILLIKEGHQEIYSSHQELVSQGIDPARVMGLIHDDAEEDNYERDMFNYKDFYDPPSPTTISMLSLDSVNEESAQINPFDFISSGVQDSNHRSPVMTPLALFSKSMRGTCTMYGNGDVRTNTSKPAHVCPIPEEVETMSVVSEISQKSPVPPTVAVEFQCEYNNDDVDSLKPQNSSSFNCSPLHDGQATALVNDLSRWPFSKTSPAFRIAQATAQLSGPDGPSSMEERKADDDNHNACGDWPFANKPPSSVVDDWPLAHKSLSLPPRRSNVFTTGSPTHDAWPLAKKSSTTFAQDAWPFANKPPSLPIQNAKFPLVRVKTLAPSPLIKVASPASGAVAQPHFRIEARHPNSLLPPPLVTRDNYPSINLLPPTPPLETPREKKAKPSPLLLNSSTVVGPNDSVKSPGVIGPKCKLPLSPLTSSLSHQKLFLCHHSPLTSRKNSIKSLSPHTSPVCGRRTLLNIPKHDTRNLHSSPVSPVPGMRNPLSSPKQGTRSLLSSPVHGMRNFLSSPVHGMRSLLSSPVHGMNSDSTRSLLSSPVHGMRNQLSTPKQGTRSPLSSPVYGMRSPLSSPLSARSTFPPYRTPFDETSQHDKKASFTLPNRITLASPLHRRRASDDGLLTVSLEPGRFDAASIYSAKSILSLHSHVANEMAANMKECTPTREDRTEISQDSRRQGTVSLKTYSNFFKAGGGMLLLAVTVLSFIIGEAGIVVSDWWLSDWANCFSSLESLNNDSTGNSSCSLDNNVRIPVYTATTLVAVVFSFSRAILCYFLCVNASRVLHNRMFEAILHAKVLFFDSNPVGRILNRFSKDIGFLDDLLPYSFCEFLLLFLRCLAIIVTATVSNPWLLLPAAAIAILFVLLRWYYLKSVNDVKRLEAIARSPVYSHLSATLQGLSTIRSYHRENVALQQLHELQNEHSQGWYLYLVMVRWFGLRIDILSVAFLAAVAFISIPLASELDAGLVGLTLTYTISLADMLQYTIRLSADVENTMVSAERVMEYGNLESELSNDTAFAHKNPPDDWPSQGEIKMEDVMFQYAPDSPMVLKNLSFSVNNAEKIGIVGRTGAGKSSLISVLYRLAEPCGQITIDGVDTKTIGLHDLRKKMSIIPQDPVLFSGSMRYNLDPFNEYMDAELWEVLEQVQLKAAVEEMEGQLSGEVSEGGSNFSVGQRQLVCLARALLRKNKILILDEATANVDPRTDGIIQAAIHDKFSACTILVIAHRLDTIMDSDKIIVLKNGQIKESDSPYKLLQNPDSKFYMMVEKTGLTASGRLHQMALESHLRKMFKKSGRITPAQVKGSIKKMSALFAKSLLQRSSGPFGLSQLQERRASILSSNSFPRALNEVGMGGPGLDNTNDPYLQSLRLPSDPSLAPNNEVNN